MHAVRHLGIVVADLEQALRFYCDLLGLRVTRVMDESGDYLERILALPNARVTTVKLAADDGATLVELLEFESPLGVRTEPLRPHTLGLTHVAFTVNDLDDAYARLVAAGVAFNSPPQVTPDGLAKVTFCRGPEGTLIELVEVLPG